MRFFEIARIPKSQLDGWGDADTIAPQQEPKGAKPLPGGSGYKYHVNRKGGGMEITLYDKGEIIAELDSEEDQPMPNKIIYFEEARLEVKEAKAWYKKQQDGLQKKFAIAIKKTIISYQCL